jgi:hypothetical protein
MASNANTVETLSPDRGAFPSIPNSVYAPGIWTPDDIAHQLQHEMRGLQWPPMNDPNFANVVTLIHMNEHGVNANLRMLPASRNPNDSDAYESVGGGGVAALRKQTRQFGIYSFTGASNSRINHNTNNPIALSTNAITAEGWFYTSTTGTSRVMWDFRTSSGDTVRPMIYCDGTGGGANLKLALFRNGANIITSAGNVSVNTFHHFAWCRDTGAGNSYLYLDGVSQGTPIADATNYGSTSSCQIGNDVILATPWSGFLDEYRLTVGAARYPGGTTFTVPSAPFPDY